jgi:hypothetical protein
MSITAYCSTHSLDEIIDLEEDPDILSIEELIRMIDAKED